MFYLSYSFFDGNGRGKGGEERNGRDGDGLNGNFQNNSGAEKPLFRSFDLTESGSAFRLLTFVAPLLVIKIHL